MVKIYFVCAYRFVFSVCLLIYTNVFCSFPFNKKDALKSKLKITTVWLIFTMFFVFSVIIKSERLCFFYIISLLRVKNEY